MDQSAKSASPQGDCEGTQGESQGEYVSTEYTTDFTKVLIHPSASDGRCYTQQLHGVHRLIVAV